MTAGMESGGAGLHTAETWWPSAFGAGDQHGMLNHITDAKRREAMGLVREGRLYDLGTRSMNAHRSSQVATSVRRS